MPFDTTTALFEHSILSNEESEPENPLLNSVRRALQHYEAPDQILNRTLQIGADGIRHEELAWGRNKVVWTLGGRLQRHWSFPDDHEEIRAACWAYLEEPGTQRRDSDLNRGLHRSNMQDLLGEETDSVFGPYGRVMKTQKKKLDGYLQLETTSDDVYGPGSGAMVRAVCIIFRSFARIYSDNGTEYCIHIPFLTRHAWPLSPVGLLFEQETIPEAPPWMSASMEIDPILHTLSSPLRSIAPAGLAHQIRNTTTGSRMVYQDDLPHANQNVNTFSSVKDGEKVIYVGSRSSPSHQVIVTVDTRMQVIHFYAYGYAPSSQIQDPPISPIRGDQYSASAGEMQEPGTQETVSYSAPDTETLPYSQTQKSNANSKTSSQWLVEETPVPAGWRDPRPDPGGSDIEAADLLSTVNAPMLDFQDEEEEEIIGPDYWLQKLVSIPIDHEV